jgi:hypothetical protein
MSPDENDIVKESSCLLSELTYLDDDVFSHLIVEVLIHLFLLNYLISIVGEPRERS